MKRVALNIMTLEKEQVMDVTNQIKDLVYKSFEGRDGFVLVYCPHTTAGLTINESADPDVKTDYLLALNQMINFEEKFRHAEGNSKAHVSSAFTGVSCWVPVESGKLVLGHWQSIWFCEFDGPRKRQIWVSGIVK